MLIKRNFNPIKVVGYVWVELVVALVASTAVYILFRAEALPLTLPWSIAAILGSALAIFIAFRNNSAYARWWEARTLWGSIVNASRVLGRLVVTFADSHGHQPNYDKARSESFKRSMVHLSIAYVHALRMHLLGREDWQSLERWIAPEDMPALREAHHKPNHLHMLTGRRLYQAMADGTLGGFDSFQMEGQLLALANAQGGCERIKRTPLLRQYHYFTRLFMLTFISLLPLCLIGDFGKQPHSWAIVPVVVLVAFVFAIIGKVGEVNEDPFEGRITDVPLEAICNGIERDMLAMVGDKELPAATPSVNGILW